MPTYTLTYARTVILKTTIEADNLDDARKVAVELESAGKLGLSEFEAKEDSWVDDIQDDDTVWDIERE